MSYDKTQLHTLGEKVLELINAIADGADITDMKVGTDVILAFMAASDEFQTDKDAAALDMAAGLFSALAVQRFNPEVEE